jgi:hypothetical protein
MLHHMLCYSHAAPHALSFTCFIIHMLHHPLCRSHAAPTAFVIRTLHCLLHILHHLLHILLLSFPHCTACFTYYTTCFIYCFTYCFCHSHTALPASHTTPPASHTAFVIRTLHSLFRHTWCVRISIFIGASTYRLVRAHQPPPTHAATAQAAPRTTTTPTITTAIAFTTLQVIRHHFGSALALGSPCVCFDHFSDCSTHLLICSYKSFDTFFLSCSIYCSTFLVSRL